MLKRVQVKGYKCLHDVSVDLGPFNVLIGRNDSGKSSFLQAVAEPSNAILRGRASPLRDVSTGRWSVAVSGTDGTFDYSGENQVATLHGPAASSHPLGSVGAGNIAPWLARHAEYTSTDPVSLDASQIAKRSTATSAPLDAFVESRGAGAAAHLAALALGDRKRFGAVESALSDVTKGRVQSIVVADIGQGTYTLAFRLVGGTVVPASQMSQGLLLYLGFLALIHRDPMPGILLIEEPEHGLHPLRLLDLVEMLRGLGDRGVQVILTTHSPDLLSACKPSEVRIFHRPEPDSPTEVHMLPADFERRAMREPLGQVWAARGEEGLLESRARAREAGGACHPGGVMAGRILLLGEGERDVGALTEWRRRVPCDFEGDLPRLMRRLASSKPWPPNFGYDANTIRKVAERTLARDTRPTRVGGKSKELRDAVVFSLRDGDPRPSAIVALIDATEAEHANLVRDAGEIVDQCKTINADVPIAIGIALHEVEIWMLADPDARVAAFGADIGKTPLPAVDPEAIPDPKSLWATYSGRVPAPPAGLDLHQDSQRVAAWGAMRPDVVAQVCPRGFAPFVVAALAALKTTLA